MTTTIRHDDAAAIQASVERNLRGRIANFPSARRAIAAEMAHLKARKPKTAGKQIEWSARMEAYRAVLA